MRLENVFDVDRSIDWLDPFVGGRLTWNVIGRLSVAVRGDIGGFGVGSHCTWNLAAILRYHVSRRVSIGAGYHILDINYSEGTGAQAFRYDVQMRGPVLGLDLHFERHSRREPCAVTHVPYTGSRGRGWGGAQGPQDRPTSR
jgi:hypothetical protein